MKYFNKNTCTLITITQCSGSSVLSETHYCLQAIDSHNTRIIFDKQETGQRRKTLIAIEILQSLKNKALLIVNNHYS